jgi:AAHS family 4-hydroxybenzoate transporter-like MFS transporter
MSQQFVINVPEFINRNRMSSLQTLVVALCSLVILLDGFDTQVISFVAPLLAQKLGIKVSDFGPVFGAGLFGLTVGALFIGPFADRFGRKIMICLSVLSFGVFSLATIWVETFNQLLLLRFLTGLGLGAAMPNVIAMTAEFAPARLKATLVAGTFAAFPLGAVIGGALSAKFVPVYGWKIVFIGGGILPIVFALILVAFLPESIRFLVHRGGCQDRIAKLLGRIDLNYKFTGQEQFITGEVMLKGRAVAELFRSGRAAMTLLLWVPYFTCLLMLFFMYSWLPSLMTKAGLPISSAIFATVLFNLGGVVGALVQGTLIDRYGYFTVLGLAYTIATICFGAVGFLAVPSTLLMVVIVIGGACAVGAQCGANALTTSLYPTSIRATGIGWALGIGRIGSIVGPVVGGILISMNWDNKQLFIMAGLPGLLATLAIIALAALVRRRKLMIQ